MVMAQVALVLQLGSPPPSRQVGVAAVKNSRRPGLLISYYRFRRSVLDAPLNPNRFHLHGLR